MKYKIKQIQPYFDRSEKKLLIQILLLKVDLQNYLKIKLKILQKPNMQYV